MRLGSAWLRAGGRLFHARTSGGVPELVMVHGVAVSSRYMVPLAEQLAADRVVHAVDLPGWGRSPDTGDRDLPALAGALGDYVAASGAARPVLLGNSFGCQVVVELVLAQPQLARGVVLLGPTVDPRGRTWRQGAWRLFLDGLREPRLYPIVVRDALTAGIPQILRTCAAALGDPIERRLPRVEVPALVVVGSRDPLVPVRWAAEAARLLPRGRLAVVPGAPHAVNFSAPTLTADVVRPFLERLRG